MPQNFTTFRVAPIHVVDRLVDRSSEVLRIGQSDKAAECQSENLIGDRQICFLHCPNRNYHEFAWLRLTFYSC